MQTPRPTPFAPVPAGLVHESSRTSITLNRDTETGQARRVMTTSRLRLAWVGGELQVRCEGSTVQLQGERPMRRTRGAL